MLISTATPILQRHLDNPMPSWATLSVPAPRGRCPTVPVPLGCMDGHPYPEQTCCKLWEMSLLGGEDEGLTGCRGGVTCQDAHLWLQRALCLLQCCTSAPKLITLPITPPPLPPSVSLPSVHSSSWQCHFTPLVHQLSSLLEAVLLSLPIAPCPFARTCCPAGLAKYGVWDSQK